MARTSKQYGLTEMVGVDGTNTQEQEKMKTFKQHVKEQEQQEQLMETFLSLYYLKDANLDSINEDSFLKDFADKVNKVLPKMGMKLHKGDGIISYLMKFTSVAGKMLIAAVKGDKATVKSLAATLDKGEFIDFLFKLDMVSLHLVTQPIHMIDAITGWDLMANLKTHAAKAGAVIDDIISGITNLKTKIKQVLDDSVAKPFLSFFDQLETTIVGN